MERSTSILIKLNRQAATVAMDRSRAKASDVNRGGVVQGFFLRTNRLIDVLIELRERKLSGRCYLLPRSRTDIKPDGIVFLADDGLPQRGLPSGIVVLKRLRKPATPKVWIPCDAELSVQLPDHIIDGVFPKHFDDLVWFSNLGLVGFGSGDRVRCHDWIQTPAATSMQSWVRPPEVDIIPSRLTELSSLQLPTDDSFDQQMQRELGVSDLQLWDSDQPNSGAQSGSMLARSGQWLLAKLDRLAKGLNRKKDDDAEPQESRSQRSPANLQSKQIGRVSGTGAGGAGIAAKISAAMAMRLASMLQEQREKQIDKLLGMLKDDPDRGLKFAIPIGGLTNAFRGFAMPGLTLASRLANYSFDGLTGGGAIDLWAIGDQYQAKLRQSYRELANQEVAAGRFRRAAYIYAHLLNDFHEAAKVLERGHFYAEAAVLHRDKLKSLPNAARCLALGGQYEQAAKIYIDLSNYEQAGEVYLKADEPQLASEMFEHAYAKALSRGAVIHAAKILSDKLARHDEAIELLCRQWPSGNEVTDSAKLAFDWMGRDGLHDQADKFLQRLLDQADESCFADVAKITGHHRKRYPERTLQLKFDDTCRLAVSRALKSGSSLVQDEVLAMMRILDHRDVQLRRDCLLYETHRGVQSDQQTARQSVDRVRGDVFAEIGALQLDRRLLYTDFQIFKSQLLAVGVRSDRLQLHRVEIDSSMRFSNRVHSGAVKLSVPWEEHPPWISSTGFDRSHKADSVRVYAETYRDLLETARHDENVPPIGLFVAARRGIVAAVGEIGKQEWIVVQDRDRFLLADAAVSHDLSIYLNDELSERMSAVAPAKLAVVEGQPFVAIGAKLITTKANTTECWELDSDVRCIVSSRPRTRRRLAIVTESSLEIRYLDSQTSIKLCSDHQYDQVMIFPSGNIVAWAGDTLHCFAIRDGVGRRVGILKVGDQTPVKLLQVNTNLLALAFSDGMVRLYRLK